MINIIPMGDRLEHQQAADCWCEPTVEWIDEHTGLPHPNGPLVTHNSVDGREARELVGLPSKGWAVYVD